MPVRKGSHSIILLIVIGFLAVNGQDYAVENPSFVTFGTSVVPGPPSDSECITISILDDDLLEGDQEFSVDLTGVGVLALFGEPFITTVTIHDDDGE